MKSPVLIGIAIGLALAFALILGGLWGLLAALVFGGIGGVLGAHVGGLLNLREVWDGFSRGRRG